MKTLIVYSSKYGVTAETAEALKEKLKTEAQLVDIAEEKAPDLKDFDRVVIGSSIYIGQVYKKIREYVLANQTELLTKSLGIYLCCGLPNSLDQYLSQAFPVEILDHAVTGCFGGELRKNKMKMADRMITNMMLKATAKDGTPPPQLLLEQIDQFAERLNAVT